MGRDELLERRPEDEQDGHEQEREADHRDHLDGDEALADERAAVLALVGEVDAPSCTSSSRRSSTRARARSRRPSSRSRSTGAGRADGGSRRAGSSPGAGMTWEKCAISDEIVSGPTTSVKTPTATSRTAGIAKNVEYASADASIVPLSSRNSLTARTKIARQSRKERSRSPGSQSRGSLRSGCGVARLARQRRLVGQRPRAAPLLALPACHLNGTGRDRVAEIGAGRFELPASRPQTGRSDQAELRPARTQCKSATRTR